MPPATPAAAFRIELPPEREDEVVALLAEHGTLGLEHRNEGTLLAYFEAGPGILVRLRAALASIAGSRVEACAVPDVDWVARFRDGFRAFEAAGFRIVPEWEGSAESSSPRTLIVDPGRAFGTGTHETTRLCLAALGRLARDRGLGRVADLGTGSGLLAIAARKLGAAVAIGVDNDAEALVSARRHARLNGVEILLAGGDCGRGLRPASFDTVVGNLTAPLLLERRDEIAGLRHPGGTLVLSGLLVADVAAIADAYRGFGPLAESRDGEWAAVIVGARPA